MTKVRAPLTFALAVTTIKETIGKAECARATGLSDRTIDHWSDSENATLPNLDYALALDIAFLNAGGGYAPIFESYERQMAVARSEPVACRDELAKLLGTASREFGDAWAHCVQALRPNATPAQIQRAILETEEADALFPLLIGLLKALLAGNGAGREALGGS
jgi:hypothetical protein